MSVQAITWAYALRGLNAGQKFVLVTLCNRADEDWSCYPSVSLIAEETGFKERAVRNHLDYLEAVDLVRRTRTRNSDGTLGRYRFFIQRQIVPVAKSAAGQKIQQKQEPAKSAGGSTSGKKRHSPAAKSAGHNRQIEPKDNIPEKPNEAFAGLWSLWPAKGRQRSAKKALVQAAFEREARKVDPDRILLAAKLWLQQNPDEQFTPALERWLAKGKYEHFLPEGNVVNLPSEQIDWALRMEAWAEYRNWRLEWGPPPDQPGCLAPQELLNQPKGPLL